MDAEQRRPLNLLRSAYLAGPDDLASLTALCVRADRMECGTAAPWLTSSAAPSGMQSLSDLIGGFTVAGREKLLEAVKAHPIYRRVAEDVPLAVTAPTESPFDPLRRVWVIADSMARPVPRKWPKNLSRPGKKRDAELRAIRHLQHVTVSPLRKRKLAEWTQELEQPSPVTWRKLAHPALWWLAFHLWTRAYTADVQLLLQAAPLVDSAGCDDSTAARYIKQVRRIVRQLPRTILTPAAPSPGVLGLLGLTAPLPGTDE